MKQQEELIYINPKDLKDIDFKVNYPPCSCPWYVHWIPFRKHTYKSVPICPVTNIEMQIEVVQVALKLFSEHVDKEKMVKELEELMINVKDVKCTCV